jgi:inhibitor of cysteine peptidase
MIIVDETQGEGSVGHAPGETLAVRLREGAATGYLWSVEAADGLALSGNRFVAGAGQPGATGYREFCFQADAPGRHVLRFKHGREWEGEASRQYSIEVRVG